MNSENKPEQLHEDLLSHMRKAGNDPAALLDASFDIPQQKRKSCCMVFSLQTGIMIIFTTDIFNFVLLCCVTGMTAQSLAYDSTSTTAGFTMMTDGLCIILFFYRLAMGIMYMRNVLFPKKMDYQYIMEFGKLRWHTKRVKTMRIYFKNYALASNITSIFIFIQNLILFLALFNNHDMYFRYLFLLFMSAFTVLCLKFVNSHLEELDEQVTFRISKYSEAVAKREVLRRQQEEAQSQVTY
uniref:Uncharacterized protein n=1 Tax=Favella ehrenbergii TaxID=182087 RepID=A0A7S3HXD2_9SPIT|mmetsp:Transcript_15655/g.19700  ORF Transcript_15655/g.19700 Transcript_15655/m.19700 type:complete len:240 (+) Transcript_15655:109-828(+)